MDFASVIIIIAPALVLLMTGVNCFHCMLFAILTTCTNTCNRYINNYTCSLDNTVSYFLPGNLLCKYSHHVSFVTKPQIIRTEHNVCITQADHYFIMNFSTDKRSPN